MRTKDKSGRVLYPEEIAMKQLQKLRAGLHMKTDEKIAKLAYALQDSESTCKMADLSETDREQYFERAKKLFYWIEFHGADLTKRARREPLISEGNRRASIR